MFGRRYYYSMKPILVKKADGSEEQFRSDKLRRSLKRAGANGVEIEEVVRRIEAEIHDGITTEAIYRKAFSVLRDREKPAAAKYSLRRALFGLGPTGFPFEDFIARLFEAEGYTTKTRLTIRGKCATHEIDVAGYKPDHSFVVEAKFHSRPGVKSDLQVAMYSYARYLDLKEKSVCKGDVCGVVSLYLITNTKFSKAAIDYASCAGIELIGWNTPKGNSLEERIERVGLYPITVLASLSTAQKAALLKDNIILCRELLEGPHLLENRGISPRKIQDALAEAGSLCGVK